jgi:hypothetical protein
MLKRVTLFTTTIAPALSVIADVSRSLSIPPASSKTRSPANLTLEGLAMQTRTLGIKNRDELHGCFTAEAASPLDPALIERIDQVVGRGQ